MIEEIKEDINEVFDIYIQNQQLKNKLREAVNINISLQNQLQQKENIIKEVREFAKLRKEMYERQENVVGQEVIISLLNILDKGEQNGK